jgi:hypothetical protein
MTRAQLTAMVIFLKEAFVQIDNARQIAVTAKDRQTERDVAALQRDVSYEITRLDARRDSTT